MLDVRQLVRHHALELVVIEQLENSLGGGHCSVAVVAAGGGLTKDIFPFPGGRRFQFTDPNGNELAVWSDR